MKGKDIIAHAVRTEMPDMEQLRQNVIKRATAKVAVKRSVWVRRLVPVTACAILLLATFIALPHLQNTIPNTGNNFNSGSEIGINENGDNGNNSNNGQGNGYVQNNESANNQQEVEQTPQHSDNLLPPEFVGLPVTNHCLPQENPMASRMGVGSLLDILGTPGRAVQFWDANPVQAFAFVRVVETTQDGDMLTSVVEVLRTVWSRERELPEIMTLVQHSGAIMCCSPYGEMMREGGVFLLPLWYNDGSMQGWREGWFNWTYRDVLFEIDDKGLVWSRSNFSAFNRFDGRHTNVLTGAILGIANGDENLGRDVAHTWFGGAADEGVLTIVTITSYESLLLFPTGQELWNLNYIMRVNEILSTPTPYGLQRGGWFETQQRWRENWQVSEQWWEDWENDLEISLTETSFSRGVLNVGEQFLVFIAPSFSDWSAPFTFDGNATRINADGTITPVSGEGNIWNVFDDFDGYTVERLAELAYLANTWHEEYVEP